MKMLIAGGSGLIGKPLVMRLVEEGHFVVVLSRKPSTIESTHDKLTVELWDGVNVSTWAKQIDGSDIVINVTGELIAGKRWSQTQRKSS